MVDVEKIAALTGNRKLLEFSKFIILETGGRSYPNYRDIDLMKIAPLVSQVFVIDFRAGTAGEFVIHFSGSGIDDLFGRNIVGLEFKEFYTGSDAADFVANLYQRAYETGVPAFTRRWVHFKDARIDKNRTIENIMFPCSSDGSTIDFGLGYAHYSLRRHESDNVYTLIEP